MTVMTLQKGKKELNGGEEEDELLLLLSICCSLLFVVLGTLLSAGFIVHRE